MVGLPGGLGSAMGLHQDRVQSPTAGEQAGMSTKVTNQMSHENKQLVICL
jgi:hypothetical protein